MKEFVRFTGDNMYPDGIEASEALNVLCSFFLGDDWHIVDSLPTKQVNVYIVDAILSKYPVQYKKFCKKNNWHYAKSGGKSK